MATMSSRHTPGKWVWNGHALQPQTHDHTKGAVHTILEVETFAWGYLDSDRQATRLEDEANRAVIAAAPELLEAAQRVYQELADGHLTIGAIEDLADAIKLATGEAP